MIKKCPICEKTFRVKLSHAKAVCCSLKCKGENSIRVIWKRIENKFNKNISDVFAQMYLAEKKSVRQIAKILEINERTVTRALNDFAIPIRYGSDAVKTQWINNENRKTITGERFSNWKKNNPEKAREHSRIGNLALIEMKGMTNIEQIINDIFLKSNLSFTVQFSVGNKFLCDFAFPKQKLIIECDGEYWHSKPHRKRLDYSKDRYLEKCGYRVIRLKEKDILQNPEKCLNSVLELL